MEYVKGMKIALENDEIFQVMGFQRVTGLVVLTTKLSVHFQCNETRAIEMFSKDTKGKVTILNQPKGNNKGENNEH